MITYTTITLFCVHVPAKQSMKQTKQLEVKFSRQ